MPGHLSPSLVSHDARIAPSSTCEICSRHATPAARKFKEQSLNNIAGCYRPSNFPMDRKIIMILALIDNISS